MTETITIEKQVWESTLRVSMERAAEIEKLKTAINSALNFLACPDRISETECNEQMAFDVLKEAINAKKA